MILMYTDVACYHHAELSAKSMRTIMTRKNSDYVDFLNFVGIKSVDDDGNIEFLDGDIGTMYRVSGSASVLLFEQDRDAIITVAIRFIVRIEQIVSILYYGKGTSKGLSSAFSCGETYHALDTDDPDLFDNG